MKYIIYFFGIVLLLGLNLGFFGNFRFYGQMPNFALLLALCFALEKSGLDYLFVAFVSGLILDFFSTSFFGGFTLSLLIVCFLIQLAVTYYVAGEINWRTLSLGLLCCLILANLFLWMYWTSVFKLNWTKDFVAFSEFRNSFLPAFLYNLLFLYPVYLYSLFLKNIAEKFSVRQRSIIR